MHTHRANSADHLLLCRTQNDRIMGANGVMARGRIHSRQNVRLNQLFLGLPMCT